MFICATQIHPEVAKIDPKMPTRRPLNYDHARVSKYIAKQRQNGTTPLWTTVFSLISALEKFSNVKTYQR